MKNKIFIMFFFFAVGLSPSYADVYDYPSNISYIETQIPAIDNVVCKFNQEKTVLNSDVVLKSSGDFKFEKEKGVTFYTNYPVKSVVSYTNGEYNSVNKVIKAISNKNYKKIEQEFSFYFTKNNSIWNLGLKPKENSRAYGHLASIEIFGKNDISKLIITMTDGTKTTINFIK